MQRILSMAVVLCLILSLCPGVCADQQMQHEYSTSANSGIRHEVCTTLLGTHVSEYYTGDYTYDALSSLSGDELVTTLRSLMTSTHTYKSSYNDCHYLANATDCENGDGTSISLIYSSYSATQEDWCNLRTSGWNREHVWPTSLGGWSNPTASTKSLSTDLHHVRPVDQLINSSRSNRKYGNVSDGSIATGASYTDRVQGGTYNASYFEPLDNAKGDVARICLYMYVRYGGDSNYNCGDLTAVFESIDVLLSWCALDPVDTWEMGRNEVVGAIQGNRNVFIDYPELAWLIFDREVPSGMTTPSAGEAPTVTKCTHTNTTVKNAYSATCTAAGYTGDTLCADCGETLSSGSTIAAPGHADGDPHGVISATCGAPGYTGDVLCSKCGAALRQGDMTDPTGDHTFGDWTVTKEATTDEAGEEQRVCSICSYGEVRQIEQLAPTETQPAETEPIQTQPTEALPVETVPAPTAPLPTTQAPSETEPTTIPDQQEPESGSYILSIVLVTAAAAVAIIIVLTAVKRKKQ